MMGLIGFDESNLELQVSVEKADIDQAGNVNLEACPIAASPKMAMILFCSQKQLRKIPIHLIGY